MSLLVGLLLLCFSSTPTCSQRQIDSNDLLYELFFISRGDSASMEQLMRQHTSNGVVDRVKYDEELQRLNPTLYSKMTSFRKIYREIDAQDKAASHFIDAVLLTARQARDLEITRQLETKTILDSFKALPQSSRDYLIAKLPALKSLVSSFTEKPPYGLETSSPTSVTRSSPTSSTMVAAITSPRLSELEAKKLLESAIGDLEKSSKQSSSAFSYRFQPIIAALRNIGNNPLSSSLGDFKKVFEQYRKSAQRLLHWCNKLHTPDCEAVSLSWSSTLRQILKAAVAADPTNSVWTGLSSNYPNTFAISASTWDQRLRTVITFAQRA